MDDRGNNERELAICRVSSSKVDINFPFFYWKPLIKRDRMKTVRESVAYVPLFLPLSLSLSLSPLYLFFFYFSITRSERKKRDQIGHSRHLIVDRKHFNERNDHFHLRCYKNEVEEFGMFLLSVSFLLSPLIEVLIANEWYATCHGSFIESKLEVSVDQACFLDSLCFCAFSLGKIFRCLVAFASIV